MKTLDEPKAIRLKIMDFLSRREHSSKEIYEKMAQRVESVELLKDSIEELQNDGLLSDERFAESYFQSRKRRGFGPIRIKYELNQRGIEERIFNSVQKDTDWSSLAFDALKKKTGGRFPIEDKDKTKLRNFLNYRGFEFSDINKAFSMLNEENL